jgi:multiple sugar transport system substrate-binding protein
MKDIATKSERQPDMSRRSFVKRTLLGTGALALSRPFFERSAYASTGPVTITYWHGWTGEWEKMVQFVVDNYHAKQNRVRITPVVVPWTEFVSKLTAAIAAGNPPDIATFFNSAPISTLAAQDAIIALDDISGVDLAAAQAWFEPDIFALGQYKGKTYGLSYWAGDFCLLFNKEHFKAAGLDPAKGPTTIAELDACAEKLTQKTPEKALARMGFSPHTDDNQAWLFGTIFGGSFYDSKSQRVTANDPNIVRALDWFQSYAKKFGAKELAAFQAGLSSERSQNLDPFISGKLSIMSQGPWKLGDLKLFGDKLDYGVIAPPLLDSGAPSANWIHGDIQVIPKGCKDPRAAADFVFFTGGVNDPEGYAQRVTWGNRPINMPVSRAVFNQPAFQKVVQDYPGFQTYIDALFNSKRLGSPPVMPAAAFYADRLESVVQQVMLMQVEPKAALESLTAQVQQQTEMMGVS